MSVVRTFRNLAVRETTQLLWLRPILSPDRVLIDSVRVLYNRPWNEPRTAGVNLVPGLVFYPFIVPCNTRNGR